MDGSLVTDTSSAAYQQISKMTIEDGLYKEGPYVGIAMNDFYGDIGDKFKITLSSGQVFYAVMADTKQDRHVDENYADSNGGIVEFIVDTDTLDTEAKFSGSLNCIFTGYIVKLEREVN